MFLSVKCPRLEVDETTWPSGRASNAGSGGEFSNGHASGADGSADGKNETAKWKNFVPSVNDETPFIFSEPLFKPDEGSFASSELAEKIFGVSFAFSATPFVLSKPSSKTDEVSLILSEPRSALKEVQIQDSECQTGGQKFDSRNKPPSEFGHQIAHLHAEGSGDSYQGMNTCCLLSTFDLAKIDWMQVSFFRQLFLAHIGFPTMFADGFPDYFLIWQLSRHTRYASKKWKDKTHCITFYFLLALFVEKN
jgi:hypothetical protein